MGPIRIALVGVGNCACALVQGLYYYRTGRTHDCAGLMHWDVGGYKPSDIEVAAAFDIDERKVGLDLSLAIFALPNCTTRFVELVPETGVPVIMGRVLDGFSESMKAIRARSLFRPGLLPRTQPRRGRESPSENLRPRYCSSICPLGLRKQLSSTRNAPWMPEWLL